MTRFPIRITTQELPPKRESWPNVIGKGMVLIAIILFLALIFFPMLEANG